MPAALRLVPTLTADPSPAGPVRAHGAAPGTRSDVRVRTQADDPADVRAGVEDDDPEPPVTVPVQRGTRDVVRVPAVLLLSAAGRCACEQCCRELARRKERERLRCVG